MRKMLIICTLVTSCFVFGQNHSNTTNNDSSPAKIVRMGSYNTQLFDDNWLFARFGLMPDGTIQNEPANIEVSGFDDASWRNLNLPHDWAIEGPFRVDLAGETGKLPYKGIGWYRKHFRVEPSANNKRFYLDFDGAMANAKVWVNGKLAGGWAYGYNSFRVDITPFLTMGSNNVIAVRLDTEKWDSRWYSGAGLYRHVWLVKTDQVHIAHWGTYITTPFVSDTSAIINLEFAVENHNAMPVKATITTTIHELDMDDNPGEKVGSFEKTSITVGAGKLERGSVHAKILNPSRWDIASPNRYVALTQVLVSDKVVDTYYTAFGVRTIEFTARNGFLLNGKRVFIKGTCNHHDLGALGTAINTSALRRQLSILKEMGCNSLRTSHNPPAPELLELADKMGFLVWDEAFDTWKKGKREWDYNKLYDEWHEKDLTAMVHRDRNHPSVFIWSIGNEVMDQRNVEMTKHLADIVRREDPTRPVSNGYNDPDGSRAVGSVMALDLMGVNYFFDQQPHWDADPRYANMPTIGSETSSCITSRGEYFFDTQYKNWQISSYDSAAPDWGCMPDLQFRTNNSIPHLVGEYVWTGFDYLGEPTPYNSDETNLLNFRNDPSKMAELQKKIDDIRQKKPPSRSSYFGIIDLGGFPKDRFYLYQAHWRPDFPMAHILPHWNWPERIDTITPVHVYTSGEEAELFLNGMSLGRKSKVAGHDFRLVWPNVKYKPGVLKVIAYKNETKWAEDSVMTTAEASKIALCADKTEITAGENELIFVTARIQDKTGLTVPRSKPLVHFKIQGEGKIVATDNGDPTDHMPFQSHQRCAFNGLALLIAKANQGGKGTITITASSDGLESAEIKIKIK